MPNVPQEIITKQLCLKIVWRKYPGAVIDVQAWHARHADSSRGSILSDPPTNFLFFLLPSPVKREGDVIEGFINLTGIPLSEFIRGPIRQLLLDTKSFAVSMHNAAMWGEKPIVLHLLEVQGRATASFVEVNIDEHSRTFGEKHDGPTESIWLSK